MHISVARSLPNGSTSLPHSPLRSIGRCCSNTDTTLYTHLVDFLLRCPANMASWMCENDRRCGRGRDASSNAATAVQIAVATMPHEVHRALPKFL